jgi:CheY-like chemotaxis protein
MDFVCVGDEEATRTTESSAAQKVAYLQMLNGRRILLAEDHPLNAEIAKKLLGKAGCEVTWMKNGQEAVDLFSSSAPGSFDTILMDIRMPLLGGLEATQHIRALHRDDAGRIPIIAMTANAYAEDVKASLNAGMNDHLSKPIQPMILYETIAKWIAD